MTRVKRKNRAKLKRARVRARAARRAGQHAEAIKAGAEVATRGMLAERLEAIASMNRTALRTECSRLGIPYSQDRAPQMRAKLTSHAARFALTA